MSLVNSSELLSGVAIALYRKLVEGKDQNKTNVKEGIYVILVNRLARAWNESGMVIESIPAAQRLMVYSAILNILRDLGMSDASLDAERLLMDAIESAGSLAVGQWASSALALTW